MTAPRHRCPWRTVLRPSAAAVAGLLLSLALSSCVRVPLQHRVIEIHRYAIDPEISTERADSARALTLLVRPFQGSGSQVSERMLYSDEGHEMDFYFYNRWTVPPEKMVEDALVQDLMSWGFFGGGVYQGDAGIIPTHELQGRLVKLYADNGPAQPSAVFDAAITVLRVDPRTYQREIIYQQDLPVTVARRNREIGSFVEATNEAGKIWLEQVRSELEYLFRREARAAATGGDAVSSGSGHPVPISRAAPAAEEPAAAGSTAPGSKNPGSAAPGRTDAASGDSAVSATAKPEHAPADTAGRGGAASP